MSDDFGTVNARRGDRAREIEILRQQYLQHRESLSRLIADAPTEHLAGEYQRLIGSIDMSLTKLNELEGRPQEPLRGNTFAAADRPLMSPRTASGGEPPVSYTPPPESAAANPRMRVAAIVIAGVLVLAVIGWLIMRASSDRRAGQSITETTATQPVTETAIPVPVTPAPAQAAVLKVAPAVADYGTIRKGTRAVRQFEASNTTTEPMTIAVARSQCRCLYYDYAGKVPAKGKETITVTVDGAKAKAGALNETLEVTAKGLPDATTTIGVRAEIR
jgi:hypothetical protein